MPARPRAATAAGAAAVVALALAALVPTSRAVAQDAPASAAPLPTTPGGRAMTIEELEAYIGEQKDALERVERNREITREKAQKVTEELERRNAREADLREEVRTLCEERRTAAEGPVNARNACEEDAAG